jgi:type IV secretion system protein VirB6
VFEFILGSADQAVEQFVFGTWETVIASSVQLVTALMVTFVAVVGYLLWLGRIELSRSDLGVRLAQLAVVFVVATHVDVLDRFFYRMTTDVPGSVATAMVQATGRTSGGINQSLDEIFVNGILIGGRILDQATITDVGTVLLGYLMLAVVVVALIPVAFVLLLSKLAVGVLLGLAPFAVLLYLLPATRNLFEGYLRQLLGFALIPTMIYALLGLVLSMIDTVSKAVLQDGATSLPGMATVCPYVLVMLVVGLLATQVVSWSSGIAGALSLSATGAFAKPAQAVTGTLAIAQAGGRQASASNARTGTGRAGAFANGALRQGIGLRPARSGSVVLRTESTGLRGER